jgi:hypothetical protein
MAAPLKPEKSSTEPSDPSAKPSAKPVTNMSSVAEVMGERKARVRAALERIVRENRELLEILAR